MLTRQLTGFTSRAASLASLADGKGSLMAPHSTNAMSALGG